MRTTKSEVNSMFERFISAIGGKVAKSYDDVGGYELDYNPHYGGYRINKIVTKSGGIQLPFGDRQSAKQFIRSMWFAVDALEETIKNGRQHG